MRPAEPLAGRERGKRGAVLVRHALGSGDVLK